MSSKSKKKKKIRLFTIINPGTTTQVQQYINVTYVCTPLYLFTVL